VTFQTPSALLLLAAVPLAALLLGRGLRRRTRRIAAFPILAGLVDSLPLLPRSHLLRRRLQVLVFLTAVACAAAAAGGPILGAADDPSQRAVILIDDIALWREGEGRSAAWDALLAEASRTALSFRSDDRVLVVRTAAGLVQEGPLPPRRAAALIRKLRPALGPLDPASCADEAAALAGTVGSPLVRVVTPDPARWETAVSGRGEGWVLVGVPPAAGPAGNHALLDVELRPDFFVQGRLALFCRVGAFSTGGSEALTLRVSRDGTVLAERSFTLAAGGSHAEVFPELDAGLGVLRVEIAPRDRFPDDDVFLAPVRGQPALPMELVTEGNAPLEAALRAIPGVELAIARPPAGEGPVGRIRVFDRVPPTGEERGALLAIAPPQGMPGIAYRGDAIDPRDIRTAGGGALLRGVAIEHLRPRRLPILVLPDGNEPVLTADGHPLVAAGRA
jgi:hypothetical protein